MTIKELKLEYTFIGALLEILGPDDGTIRYEADVMACTKGVAFELCKFLPAEIPRHFVACLRYDCEQVLLGSACPRTVSGIRSALHVLRQWNTGIWW